MTVRAGIVVTGTEVLTGVIGDRNGPWLSDRLRDLGVDLAHILIVGDRREDMAAALGFMRDQGMSIIALSVQPTAPVYVCLISAAGAKLIPGLILQPGSTQPTYHSHSFTITLGNSSVKLFIDGSQRIVPPSSQAIGYSVTKAGRHTLPAAQQPTCK